MSGPAVDVSEGRGGRDDGEAGGGAATGTAAPSRPRDRPARHRGRTAIAVGIVLLAIAVPLRELFRHQGPPMEEGFMLVFPELVLAGQVPHVDFLHLYGPGSLWLIAGFFEVLGVSLATERLVGLLQILGVVFATFALVRPWGRRLATLSALAVVLVVLFPVGLTAMAWNGAMALGLAGLAVAVRVPPATGSSREGRVGLVVGGALAGLALLFRPDLIVAVVLGFGALALRLGSNQRKRLLLGLALGLAPYLVHVATAGLGNVIQGMVIDPVFELRDGRTLPVPPSLDRLDGALEKAGGLVSPPWPLPTLTTPQQAFACSWLLTGPAVTAAAVGVRSYRRDPESRRGRTLLAVGLFGLGTLSQALQRPDSTHLAWVSYVPLGFLPVALHELLRRPLRRRAPGTRALVAGGAVLVGMMLLIPHFTTRSYLDYSRQALFDEGIARWSVDRAGRNFWLGQPEVADEVQAMLDDIGEVSEPGDSVIVGSADLRFTNYSDAYLYFLLPELVPGTYYIEMDPGVANAPDSGLADELREADLFIASNVWDIWVEPNSSQDPGSPEPNRVVDEQYCLVEDYGEWIALYENCG